MDLSFLRATGEWLMHLCYHRQMTTNDPDKASLNGIALSALKRERLRTGLGSHAVSALFPKKKNAPTPAMIDNWLSGKQKFAKSSHLELVLMTYAKQPDALPDGTKAAYVTMTDALRDEIRQIHGRSASGYLDEAPERFSRAQLSHLMTGRKKTLSRVMLDFFRNQAEKVPEKRHQTPYPPKPDLNTKTSLPFKVLEAVSSVKNEMVLLERIELSCRSPKTAEMQGFKPRVDD